MSQSPTSPSKHIVSATVAHTGEVIEYGYANTKELAEVYKDVTSRLEAYRTLKSILLDTGMRILMKDAEKEN